MRWSRAADHDLFMPSFEPDEVAEAIARVVPDPELYELSRRIRALSAEPCPTPQTAAELAWLRQLRIARVSQLLDGDHLQGTAPLESPGAA